MGGGRKGPRPFKVVEARAACVLCDGVVARARRYVACGHCTCVPCAKAGAASGLDCAACAHDRNASKGASGVVVAVPVQPHMERLWTTIAKHGKLLTQNGSVADLAVVVPATRMAELERDVAAAGGRVARKRRNMTHRPSGRAWPFATVDLEGAPTLFVTRWRGIVDVFVAAPRGDGAAAAEAAARPEARFSFFPTHTPAKRIRFYSFFHSGGDCSVGRGGRRVGRRRAVEARSIRLFR